MPFVVCHDPMFDEVYQCKVSDELGAKLRQRGGFAVYDQSVPNVPIKSRYRSNRHPGWADDEET